MTTAKRQRLVLILVGLGLLAGAAGLALAAFRDNVVFFQSPSDIAASPPSPDQRLRIGGLVLEGSVSRDAEGVVSFAVTDGANETPVRFQRRDGQPGVLPDLFREGQGVVAEGMLADDGTFVADEVLAKHDETYMPPEVADALREQGVWQGDE
jgi:cytochrome c-type biogenesis protein CcmE